MADKEILDELDEDGKAYFKALVNVYKVFFAEISEGIDEERQIILASGLVPVVVIDYMKRAGFSLQESLAKSNEVCKILGIEAM